MDKNINNKIPSNQEMYEMICDLNKKYELLQKNYKESETKNQKTILLLNRQFLTLRTYIDKYITKFIQEIEYIKSKEMNNIKNINIDNINNDLEINYNDAKIIVEQKFGNVDKIEKDKDIKNFENLLETIVDGGKNILDEENLKEFNKLSKKIITHQISPAIIIGDFFKKKKNNKINENRNDIDVEFVTKISNMQSEILNAANKIEYEINNKSNIDEKEKDNKIENKKDDKKLNKKKSKKDNKIIDIVAEFRKEYYINEDYASDEEILKILKKNKNDKLKTYNIIMAKFRK